MKIRQSQEHLAACAKCDQDLWFENSKSQELEQRRATFEAGGVNTVSF